MVRLDGLEQWALDQLQVRQRNAKFQVLRDWSCGRVMRIETGFGRYIVKACADHCRQELTCATQIGTLLPLWIPSVVASEQSRGWLLSQERGAPLGATCGFESWMAVASAIAQMQEASCAVLPRLDCWRSVSDAPEHGAIIEFHEIVERLPCISSPLLRLSAVMHNIINLPIPSTIVHGDLSRQNILLAESRVLFVDWSESFVGCPVLDAVYFLVVNSSQIMRTSCCAADIKLAILSPWLCFVGERELLDLVDEAIDCVGVLRTEIARTKLEDLGTMQRIIVRERPLLLTAIQSLLRF
jgi:hypothetical protein